MSPFDIIPLIIIVLSLAGIIFIIVRKFPVLAAIDIKSIKSEQEADKKEEIIVSRLQRKIGNLKKVLIAFFSPFYLKVKELRKKIFNKVLAWEKRYAKPRKVAPIVGVELEQRIKSLFFEADQCFKDGKSEEAEKRYIEIISLDHKNIEAYKKLGIVYLEQKNYEHACETFQHILKLNPGDVETLIDLGLIYKQRGENEKALALFQKAVEIEPTNPKCLDFLIEMSIIVGNKDLAKKTFKKLKEVNPENQKLGDFEERIKGIK